LTWIRKERPGERCDRLRHCRPQDGHRGGRNAVGQNVQTRGAATCMPCWGHGGQYGGYPLYSVANDCCVARIVAGASGTDDRQKMADEMTGWDNEYRCGWSR
jgi:hypothetical protein